MIILKSAADFKAFVLKRTAFPSKTGFVPTMGALHKGHLTLIEQCKQELDLTIVSIFVNPTQFNDAADFKNYPVTIESDIAALEEAGCDVLFMPKVAEIYPVGLTGNAIYQLGSLETLLEGFFRPGHFQGVCQVMDRLLTILKPGHLYMGSKDYQQCMVIKKLLQIIELDTAFHMITTVREVDGLAMSSRNVRLNSMQREQAAAIYRQFDFIQRKFGHQDIRALEQVAAENLINAGFSKVDYVSIADPVSLEPLNQISKGDTARVLIAAFIGNIRLIDNLEITA